MARLFQVTPRDITRPPAKATSSGRGAFRLSGPLSFLLSLFWLTLGPSPARAAKPKEPKTAEIQISGYGFLGNRELKRMLKTVELGGKKPEFFNSSFVEDSALILTARIKRDGYLNPTILVRMSLEDGGHLEATAEDLLENPLSLSLRITRVQFVIHKGILYYYESLAFEGLESIDENRARAFFMETAPLLQLKRMRIYTPERLQSGLTSLTETLQRQGYQDATVQVQQLVRGDSTGAVQVRVGVRQGPRYLVRSVREEVFYQASSTPAETRTVFPNHPYSQLWVQDFTLSLKTNFYGRGYPDVTVQMDTLKKAPVDDQVEMRLLAKVNSGPQVRIGKVEFKGEKKTKEWLLSRRVRVERGNCSIRCKPRRDGFVWRSLGFLTASVSVTRPKASIRGT